MKETVSYLPLMIFCLLLLFDSQFSKRTEKNLRLWADKKTFKPDPSQIGALKEFFGITEARLRQWFLKNSGNLDYRNE